MKIKFSFLGLILISGLAFISFKLTYSFFNDSANSNSNVFTAAASFPSPTPTPPPSISPSPSPSPSPGDVVINEINWAGSTLNGQDGQNDEWIELRNRTSHDINLANWKITGAGSSGDLNISTGVINANSYFLIANFSETTSRINITPDIVTTDVDLKGSNAQYVLKDSSNNVIDTADDGSGSPLAGANGNPKKSMERNIAPGDGTLVGSWHDATAQTNMDVGSTELGTPKAINSPP